MGDVASGDLLWAEQQFGHVELGDVRRHTRLKRMAAAACARPSGKVAAVFQEDREQQAAYDFVESPLVEVQEIVTGVAITTAKRSAEQPFVYVAVDGTSVTVVDNDGELDFGRIGADKKGARGLKVIDALAVDPQGIPVGLLSLTWWARSEQRSPPRDSAERAARPLKEKETRYWVQTVEAAAAALDEQGARGWFQIDREADSRDVLLALMRTKHLWTVRSSADRSIELEDGDPDHLRAELSRQPVTGTYEVEVVAHPNKRKPRRARMTVRVAQVTLRLRDKITDRITRLPVTAVWALEDGTTPDGEAPLDWLLYTCYPVPGLEDALKVIVGYAMRWRVEEFHRTWKSGETDVESTQLESAHAVMVWATILATVAVRIERLKRLARQHPDSASHRRLQHLRGPGPQDAALRREASQSPSHHRSSRRLARRARRLRGEVLEETEARRRRARPWPTHPPTRRPPAGDPARGGKVGEMRASLRQERGRAKKRWAFVIKHCPPPLLR